MYKKLKDKNQFKVKRDKQEKKVKNIFLLFRVKMLITMNNIPPKPMNKIVI